MLCKKYNVSLLCLENLTLIEFHAWALEPHPSQIITTRSPGAKMYQLHCHCCELAIFDASKGTDAMFSLMHTKKGIVIIPALSWVQCGLCNVMQSIGSWEQRAPGLSCRLPIKIMTMVVGSSSILGPNVFRSKLVRKLTDVHVADTNLSIDTL